MVLEIYLLRSMKNNLHHHEYFSTFLSNNNTKLLIFSIITYAIWFKIGYRINNNCIDLFDTDIEKVNL